MKTFFARHSSNLDVDGNTFSYLYNYDYVGIHFPHNKKNKLEENDSSSIDPNDYHGSGKKAINALIELARDGGYVCSTYGPFAGCKIGYVEPNTQIEIIHGKWGSKYELDGREAIMKCVKLRKVSNIQGYTAGIFLSLQPRQGTICRWAAIGKSVENRVNKFKEKRLESLMPTLQEVLCSEYLRSNFIVKYNIPQMSSLLLPVGRTLKDIDILGISFSKQIILAQVTYLDAESSVMKAECLRNFSRDNNCIKILFCNCSSINILDGIIYFPLNIVFEEYCNSEQGSIWLDSVL